MTAQNDSEEQGGFQEALGPVVDQLCGLASGPKSLIHRRGVELQHPSPSEIARIMEDLRSVFFPGYFGLSELSRGSLAFHVGAILDRALRSLREQIRRGLTFESDRMPPGASGRSAEARAARCVERLMADLPAIRRLLTADVQAAYDGDPAAASRDETIFCYPGVYAIMLHRVAHALYRQHIPLIPRMIAEYGHSHTGIDLHPGAQVGEGFFIDHGSGVVIGETTVIGDNVRIYQGVTLGAKRFPLDAEGKPIKGIARHPIVEDNVTIYAGATILGRVTIGAGSTIGGNVWLTHGVAPGSRVSQAQVRREEFLGGGGI